MLCCLCLLLYEKDDEAPWIPPPVSSIDSQLKILWMVALFAADGRANVGRLQSSGEDYSHLFHILPWPMRREKLRGGMLMSTYMV